MTSRVWSVGDPLPADHPPLVDSDDVTWLWDPYDEIYERQHLTHLPGRDGGPGAMHGSPIVDWDDLLEEYGPVREATDAEARNLIVKFDRAPDDHG